jgi:hypothetical protein
MTGVIRGSNRIGSRSTAAPTAGAGTASAASHDAHHVEHVRHEQHGEHGGGHERPPCEEYAPGARLATEKERDHHQRKEDHLRARLRRERRGEGAEQRILLATRALIGREQRERPQAERDRLHEQVLSGREPQVLRQHGEQQRRADGLRPAPEHREHQHRGRGDGERRDDRIGEEDDPHVVAVSEHPADEAEERRTAFLHPRRFVAEVYPTVSAMW